jgi:hypothetical protein
MKKLLSFVSIGVLNCAFCLPSLAQTAIAGVLYYPYGNPGVRANCTITVSGPNLIGTTSGAGQTLTPGKYVMQVANGNYSFSLQPNTGASSMFPSATSYSAQYNCPGGQGQYTETWVVPTSVSSVEIKDIRQTVTPTPGSQIPVGSLNAVGANGVVTVTGGFGSVASTASLADGNYCISITAGQVAGFVECTGGPASYGWRALTNAQWVALTNAQWVSLTN